MTDTRFFEHGQGKDVKAAQPDNKAGKHQTKTKIDLPANKHGGATDEPSHSGNRLDSHHGPLHGSR